MFFCGHVGDESHIYDRYSEAWTPDGVASVKPFQIVVTVSLSIGDFGLRALVRNHLKLIIDGNRRQVTLKTAGWFS